MLPKLVRRGRTPTTPAKTPSKSAPKNTEKQVNSAGNQIQPLGSSPNENISELTVPFTLSDDVRDDLLPYLAFGFTPINTSGGEALCGLNAICHSYNAAREAIQFPNLPEFKPLQPKHWITWLSSDK